MVRKRGKGARLPPGGLTTSTVAWLVGMPERTLSRWISRRVITPENVGGPGWAVYSWDERTLAAAYAIARLREDRVSAQRVRKAAEAIQASGRDLSRTILVSDGRDVYRVISPGELLDLTGSPGQRSWRAYQLNEWAKDIRTKAEKLGIQIRRTRNAENKPALTVGAEE